MLTLLLITLLVFAFFFSFFLEFSSTLTRNLSLSDILLRGFAIQCFDINGTPSKQSKKKKKKMQIESVFSIESFI